MPPPFNLVSADDHVQEPPDLWTKRLSKQKFGDKVPHVARQPNGVERWVVEGAVRNDLPLARAGALAADRLDDPKEWGQVPKAAYDPAERLKAMDRDGVATSVLYPSAAGLGGEVLGAIKDPALEVACVQAYNDWLLETWGKAGSRFVAQCLVPVASVQAATAEAKRAVARGHKGIVFPAAPWRINAASPHLYDSVWDPFWAAVTDLGVPVCLHSGSVPPLMMDIYQGFSPAVARGFDMVRRPSSSGMIVSRFLFSGIAERFPKLKVVFSATGLDWVPFMLEVADHEWERICRKGEKPLEMDTQPSDIFHRQCYATTSFDNVGLRLRSVVGVSNIMWQSEFPLETSTFPESVATIEKHYKDMPEADRTLILSGNATRLYGLKA